MDFQPTDKIIPPFKVSGRRAEEIVHASKHFAALAKTHESIGPSDRGFGCAKACSVREECDYRIGLAEVGRSDFEVVYVDPMNGDLWFQNTNAAGQPWVVERAPK